MQKEFFKSTEGFLTAALTVQGMAILALSKIYVYPIIEPSMQLQTSRIAMESTNDIFDCPTNVHAMPQWGSSQWVENIFEIVFLLFKICI